MDVDEEEQFEVMDVNEQPSQLSPSKTKEEKRVAMDAQRAVIQSYAKMEGKTAMDAYDHLCKAYGSEAMSKQNARRRFKEFKEDGRTDYRGKRGQHSGYKCTERTEENIAKIRDLIAEDARSTIKELTIESGLSRMTVQRIIKQELNFTKKCARWVPRLLTGKAVTQINL